ncbi:MAG: 3'(2'),5'-bisphosphate nucleotidase CysQ [Pseudomonadota bacterium]
MTDNDICRKFRELAIKAGEKILEIYDRDELQVDSKADDSPVTEADRIADTLIHAGLSEAFPGVPIVTEEKSSTHSIKAKTFFIVDPLDGTKEFIHRRGDFTVNIAYVVEGVPVLGVVYAPAKSRLFMTKPGGGALEELGPFDPEKAGDCYSVSTAPPKDTDLAVVASKSHRDQATDDYIAKYSVGDFKAAGSSLKFCLLATGEADLYPRLGRTMEWDTAAGQAVLMAAGGFVVDFETREPLYYGKSGFSNPFFIAASNGTKLR